MKAAVKLSGTPMFSTISNSTFSHCFYKDPFCLSFCFSGCQDGHWADETQHSYSYFLLSAFFFSFISKEALVKASQNEHFHCIIINIPVHNRAQKTEPLPYTAESNNEKEL